MSIAPPPPPHQDPNEQSDPSKVSMLEYVTTLVSTLDRRFDTLHEDLKDLISTRFEETDLRYQQRFDQQQKALDAALAAQKEAVQTALIAAEKATSKAESASDKRFDSVNEFRGQLADQAATMMPRSESETRFSALAEKIDDLKTFQAAYAGRESAVPNTSSQVQALADKVELLASYRDTTQGKGIGQAQLWGLIIGGVGFTATVLSVIVLAVRVGG